MLTYAAVMLLPYCRILTHTQGLHVGSTFLMESPWQVFPLVLVICIAASVAPQICKRSIVGQVPIWAMTALCILLGKFSRALPLCTKYRCCQGVHLPALKRTSIVHNCHSVARLRAIGSSKGTLNWNIAQRCYQCYHHTDEENQ